MSAISSRLAYLFSKRRGNQADVQDSNSFALYYDSKQRKWSSRLLAYPTGCYYVKIFSQNTTKQTDKQKSTSEHRLDKESASYCIRGLISKAKYIANNISKISTKWWSYLLQWKRTLRTLHGWVDIKFYFSLPK